MKYLPLQDISIEKLKNNELIQELPEFYELKKTIENGSWHNNSSTFDHTIFVLEQLVEIFKNVNTEVGIYLNQFIDQHSRKQLLFLATLFHDIAKKDTIIIDKNNTTICPGHTERGVVETRHILERFDLSPKEKDYILDIIKKHHDFHKIVDLNNKNIDKETLEYKNKFPNIFFGLILLSMADTLGSELKDNLPDEFKFRIGFYKKIINIKYANN